jgi:large subunit ribosomal protein L24
MAKLKSDDDVIVIAGKDKGKRGTVRRLLDSDRVIVGGVNMVKKHTKPNPQAGVAGGIVEQEAPIRYLIASPVRASGWGIGLKTARKCASLGRLAT